MKLILPKFQYAKVMIVGDVILDRYWYGSTRHLSSEASVPIIKINVAQEYPGGAANVAMNIASLGANSHLIGLVGDDEEAIILNSKLNNVNIKSDLISIPTHRTITKLRILSKKQQLIRLDLENNFENIDSNFIYQIVNQQIKYADALVLSDYNKGTLSNIQQLIILANKARIPILIDPKGSNFKCYSGATLLTPNLFEFEAIVGKCNSEKEIIERGNKIIIDLNLSALLITRSECGMTLLQSNRPPLHIPTKAKDIYNVTGAGDTVIGIIAATLAAGSSLEEACYFSNIAASIAINKLGTSTVSLLELKNALENNHSKIESRIITEKNLSILVNEARKRGEKIVMTNGVFDILHAGHISYLTNAKKFGDRLIVAVNSDASTKRLKGDMRPINSLSHRMIVLSALEVVDWVVSFDEDTPQRIISNILPDFLIKGEDYKKEKIAGSEDVYTNGGNVVVLNFEYDCSTSSIINRIYNKINK